MVEPTNHPARNEWERMLSGELYESIRSHSFRAG